MKMKQIAERLCGVHVRKKVKQILALTLAILMVSQVTVYGVVAHAQDLEVFHMDDTLNEAEGLDTTVCETTATLEAPVEHFSTYTVADLAAFGAGNAQPAIGDGSSGSPYQITSEYELYWFARLVNGKLTDGTAQNTAACATLMKDITINTQVLEGGSLVSDTNSLIAWTPIGGNTDSSTYSSGPQYSGVFDGGNHTISGLYFNDEGKQYVGVFGYCKGATIKNLKLADSYIRGYQRVGGICGCSSVGSSISGCTNGAAVSASINLNTAYVGGICGENYQASIEQCGNIGAVSSNTGSYESYCGGICGGNSGYNGILGRISNCWNAGAVSASWGGGGICGRNYQYASITSCYNYGAVSNNTWCGAVVGVNGSTETTLSNCYYDTAVSVSKGIGNDYSNRASLTGKTTEEFASGEICYLLNNNIDDGTQVWYQNIDAGIADTYPQFSGGAVHQASGTYTNLSPARISFKDYAPGKIWDGTAIVNPTEAQLTLENTSYGNVTITWYKDSVNDANKLDSAPSDAGTYYVVASVAATETTSAASTTSAAITISEPETLIEMSESSFPYDGTAKEPTVTVTDKNSGTVIDPSEYTVSYSNNTDAGTATVTITDVAGGNYTIKGIKTFTITKVTPILTVFAKPESGAHQGDTVKLFVALGCTSKVPSGTLTIKDGEATIASNIAITAYGVFYDWTNVGSGNHSITAVYTPSSDSIGKNYNGATSSVLSYTITKQDQSALSIGDIGTKTYGDSAFDLSATGGSGTGAVTFSSSDPTIVSISDTTATIHNAGTVTITATKAEDSTYNKTTASVSLTVCKAVPTVTLEVKSFNDDPFIYSKGINFSVLVNGVNIVISSSIEKPNGTVTIKDGDIVLFSDVPFSVFSELYQISSYSVAAGNHSFTAVYNPSTDGAGKNYESATSVVVEKTIAKADQDALCINEVNNKKYGEGTFTLETTGGSGEGDVIYSVPENNGVLTLSGDTATIIGVGTVTVTATKAADNNYHSTTATREITIGKADAPIITFPTAGGITYGQKLSASTLTGGSTAFGTFAWTNGNTIPTVKNSGYEVTFTPNAETIKNYETITNTNGTAAITVSKATPAVTVSAELSGNVGSRQAILTATVTGVSDGETPTGTVKFVNSTSGSDTDIAGATAVTITDGKAIFEWTGLKDQMYKIKAICNDSDNYTTAASAELGIDTRKQDQSALSIGDIGTKTYGDNPFDLSVNGGDGNGAISFTSSDPTIVSVSDTTATIHKAGTVTITATKAEDSTYKEASASVSLTVGKKALTIMADDKLTLSEDSYTYDGTAKEPSVTVILDGKTLTRDTDYTVTYSNNINAGTAEVTVTGKGNYSGTANTTFAIAKVNQGTLGITEVTGKKYGEGTFILETTGGSGEGDVIYSVPENSGVLTVSGDTATIIGVGTVTVTATKAADNNYNSTTTTREITIAKATTPSITFPTAGGITYGQKLSASTLTGGNTAFGTFAWTNGNTIPTVTNSGYGVTFTPNAETIKNYETITNTNGTVAITVSKATPAVTISAELSGNVGSRQATLTATVTGVSDGEAPTGTVKFVNSTSGSDTDIAGATAVTITDGKAVFEWTGLKDQMYKIKAIYSDGDNYTPATSAELEVDTRKQDQSALSIGDIGIKTYGDGAFDLSATGGSGTGAVTFTSSDPTIVSISDTTATIHKAGTVTITVTKAEDITYKEASASVELAVGKKALTIKADDKLNIIKGTAMPELTYTVTGLMDRDTFTGPTVSATAVDTNTAGEYDITISGGTLANADSYEVIYTNGKLTVVNGVYTVTVTNGTGGGSYREDQTVTITADSRSGYTFTDWSSNDGVIFAKSTASTTTFTMPGKAVTVTANYRRNSSNSGGSSGGSSSGGSSSSDNITVTTPPATTENRTPPTQVTTTVNSTVTGGTANVAISENTVAKAISKAQEEAKKNSTTSNGIVVEIKVETKTGTVANLSANLPKVLVDTLVKASVKEVCINSGVAGISLNLETLKTIQKTISGDATVSAKKVDNSILSAEAKKMVGNRPVYELTITGKNGIKVTDFGTGKVSVSIPYTLCANEKASNVVAYYIDANGKVQEMPNSVYDVQSKTLMFITDHFSKYAVGYKADKATAFTDIATHWAKESIEYVADRGMLAGTGNGKFSPNASMTRGMFVTALGRLAQADVSSYKQSSFSDVKSESYYLGYIEWAVKNHIVNGIGNGKFAPDQAISREQMAVIMANYAKVIGFELPEVHAENTFADSDSIGNYAKGAVKSMQMAGVLAGKDDNKFDPQGTATRAEVSVVLKRFVELVINSNTAEF